MRARTASLSRTLALKIHTIALNIHTIALYKRQGADTDQPAELIKQINNINIHCGALNIHCGALNIHCLALTIHWGALNIHCEI
eukprot:7136664-Pyramimonas_sp.AAC.2